MRIRNNIPPHFGTQGHVKRKPTWIPKNTTLRPAILYIVTDKRQCRMGWKTGQTQRNCRCPRRPKGLRKEGSGSGALRFQAASSGEGGACGARRCGANTRGELAAYARANAAQRVGMTLLSPRDCATTRRRL